jgi:hypothetical protein
VADLEEHSQRKRHMHSPTTLFDVKLFGRKDLLVDGALHRAEDALQRTGTPQLVQFDLSDHSQESLLGGRLAPSIDCRD